MAKAFSRGVASAELGVTVDDADDDVEGKVSGSSFGSHEDGWMPLLNKDKGDGDQRRRRPEATEAGSNGDRRRRRPEAMENGGDGDRRLEAADSAGGSGKWKLEEVKFAR